MIVVMRMILGMWLGLILAACSAAVVEPDEPYFQPGEYGGRPLPGTESLINIRLSPDGSRIALVRERTPGDGFSPRAQLWLVDADGTNPELVALGAGTVDWSPDGTQIAVTGRRGGVGLDTYIYTIDLVTRKVSQWTGLEGQVIDMGTAHLPIWFQDGKRLLVSVYTTAYLQGFDRGIYIVDTESGDTEGPLVDLMQSAWLSDSDQSIAGTKFLPYEDPKSGNIARYDFDDDSWRWITDEDVEHGLRVPPVVGVSAHDMLVQWRRVDNAEQLFLLRKDGSQVRQIMDMGGDVPHWTYDGNRIIFRRDVHKGEGARFVPFVYEVETGNEYPLWPALPDSVPQFPPLETQDPIEIQFPKMHVL